MHNIDPTTGHPLPPESIQRVLHVSPSVHVYNIPPLTSNRGYLASSWTVDNNKRQIFTARLRILETAVSLPSAPLCEKLRTDILLEDPETGQLFAGAPYTQPEVVQQAIDSSRFFAVRVHGEGGQKATLGIGFEERHEAFDFSVALQEAKKTLNFTENSNPNEKNAPREWKNDEKRDFSLKEGEMVVVNLGRRGRRNIQGVENKFPNQPSMDASSPVPLIPPPPSAKEVKKQVRLSATFEPLHPKEPDVDELGFDNGEFGEFQLHDLTSKKKGT